MIQVKNSNCSDPTATEKYWNVHTVCSQPFTRADESLQYLEWRSEQYPLFHQLMGLWGEHDEEVVLDYGCGPGNDLTGFLAHTRARKVIGIDVSEKALSLAVQRLNLHQFDPARIELIKVSDATPEIPLSSGSVNYIYCQGVLHHTSHPEKILKEFRRVLLPSGRACIMVYNRDSLWYHLYTAYDKMILQKEFQGLSLDEAFARNTDGPDCPIARAYAPGVFASICESDGFRVVFAGGYLSLHELRLWETLGGQAMNDDRLNVEHRDFLQDLTFDTRGFPQYCGKHAGIGGVYHLMPAK